MLHLALLLIQNTPPAVAVTTTAKRTHTVVAVVAPDAASSEWLPVCGMSGASEITNVYNSYLHYKNNRISLYEYTQIFVIFRNILTNVSVKTFL